MMRRMVLLLATAALTLIAAGGIALAATLITCSTNPCDGTPDDDVITGTVNAETINGKAGNDEISARDANDTINGEDGNDTMNGELGDDILDGGPNNDTMDGGDGNDSYNFADNFGADSIPADASGTDTLDFSAITTPINTQQYFNGITVDLVGPDPLCDTTLTYCLSLGGEFIENLVGSPFGDRLTGNSLNNDIRGGDGFDRLNGGAGNDNLQGGGTDVPNTDPNHAAQYDFYYLTPNWGQDTITDSGGTNDRVLPADNAAAAMPNLTVNLVSSSSPEYTDGNGNTVNWEGSVVDDAVTGGGNDTISQNSSDNQLWGGEGSDTYIFEGFVNGDYVNDSGGTDDVIDLSSYNLPDTRWSAFTTGSGSNMVRYVHIDLYPPPDVCFGGENCPYIQVSSYFDNTGVDKCAAGPGPGAIETIKFAGDQRADFARVRSLLGCPPPDTAAPDTSIISGPNGPTNNTTPTFTFTGSDNRTTTAKLKYQYQLDSDSGGWSTASTSTFASLTGLSEGAHLFEVRAVDEASNVDASPAQRSFTVDKTAPKVNSVSPTDPTIPARSTDVEANFSEKVVSSSINTSTFKLYSCTSTTSTNCAKQVTKAPVSLSTDGLKATLNPSGSLGSRTKYKAVVTTGVTDVAGNALDQDPSAAGNQEKVWYFTTGSR
jgi:Bacterial Ig-like domain/RTX calcium-binding nonapeptide repeat (4 copies)